MATRKRQARRHETLRREYASFRDLVEAGKPNREAYGDAHPDTDPNEDKSPWTGANTWEQVDRWATEGWQEGVQGSLAICEDALTFIDQECPVNVFQPVWDVTGSQVDIGAYLAGEPECMIDYLPAEISKAGKVVTICVSVSFSATMSTDTLVKRAAAITGLVMALEERQHATELWIDNTVSTMNGVVRTMRCKLKSAGDSVPMAELAFQLGHPSVLRRIVFAERHMDRSYSSEFNCSRLVGSSPTDPPKDLPEGTIYFGAVRGNEDIPDVDRWIKEQLQTLGLI